MSRNADLLSAISDIVSSEVKDRVSKAKDHLNRVSEKVLTEVVESDTFKKHVAFDINDHVFIDGLNPSARLRRKVQQSSLQNESQCIGYVRVFVSRIAGIKADKKHVYCEVQVEDEKTKTPISSIVKTFDFDQKMHDWIETLHTVQLPVRDLTSSVVIRIMAEKVLTNDQVIGQVIIPVHRMVPSLRDEMAAAWHGLPLDQESFVEGPTVYEIFPLPRDFIEFMPAVADAARTGMNKPTESLGFARIRCEFVPSENQQRLFLLQSYFLNPPFSVRNLNKPPTSASAISIDPARTQRHIGRQISRLTAVFDRFIIGPFPLWLPFSYARKWEFKVFSMTFITATNVCILYLPPNFFPMYMFAVAWTGAYLSHHYVTEEPPKIWNEEIRDPDDLLNPMQRVAKLLWIIEGISQNLLDKSDLLERIVHSLGFEDDRASMLTLLLVLVVCVSSTIICSLCTFRSCLFWLVNYWVFSPTDFEEEYRRFKFMIETGIILENDDQEEASQVVNMLKTSIRNFLLRIPTSERLGHYHICEKQVVTNPVTIQRVERVSRGSE